MPAKLTDGPRALGDLAKTGAGAARGPNARRKLTPPPWSGTWPAPGSTLDIDFANNRGWVRGLGQGGAMDAITFTRASGATYVDAAGVMRTAGNHAPRFDWGKNSVPNVRNIYRETENYSSTLWSLKTGITISGKRIIVDTSAGNHVFGLSSGSYLWGGMSTTSRYVWSCDFKPSGIASILLQPVYYITSYAISINFIDSSVSVPSALKDIFPGYAIEPLDDGYYRVTIYAAPSPTKLGYLTIYLCNPQGNISYTGDGTSYVEMRRLQLELGQARTEYQPKGFYLPQPLALKLEVDTRPGLLSESARTNRLLWCRDMTNSAWSVTGAIAQLDQIGVDGTANAASSLTAIQDGAVCAQAIALASGDRVISAYVKKLSGSGVVELSLNGVDYIPVTLPDASWYRIVLSGSLQNPSLSIRIPSSGDAIAVDYSQLEDGQFPTSPILTTSSSAARAADSVSISPKMVEGFANKNAFTWTAQYELPCAAAFVVKTRPANGACIYIGTANTLGTMAPAAYWINGISGGALGVDPGHYPSGGTITQTACVSQSAVSVSANGGPATSAAVTPYVVASAVWAWLPVTEIFLGTDINSRLFSVTHTPKYIPEHPIA